MKMTDSGLMKIWALTFPVVKGKGTLISATYSHVEECGFLKILTMVILNHIKLISIFILYHFKNFESGVSK